MKLAVTCLTACLFFVKAQETSLYETVAATADLSTLASAIDLAGLQDYFTTTTDLSLFAPNNAALALLPPKYLTPGFTPHLSYLLEYHVSQGPLLTAANIVDGMEVTMVNGESILASVSDTGISLSGAAFSDSKVATQDVASSNGLFHIVDQYFLPEVLTLTLYDLTGLAPGFTRVLDLIVQAGLESELEQENRTVLAPSDAAFEALPPEYIAEVSANPELRDSVLLYHVIIGSYPTEIITDGMEVMTVSGSPLKFGVTGAGSFAQYSAIGPSNNVTFEISDLIASNGLAATIDGVLEPPSLATTPTVAVPTAPPLSIPAPVPIATPVTIPVTTLAPALAPTTIATPLPMPTSVPGTIAPIQPGALSIYDTIALTADLSTMAAAINAVGLAEFFTSTPDLTVFLPTNAAFKTLPKQYLTPGYLPHLENIVNYHVVQGTVILAANIQDGVTIAMLNGETIFPRINDTSISITGAGFNNSRIILSDLIRTNGAGHLVDQYFLPGALTSTLYDLMVRTSGFASVLNLIVQSGLEDEMSADDRSFIAPSDTAFAALPADYLAKLSTDARIRDSVLLYHLIIGSYPQEIIVDGLTVMTASGNALKFAVVGDGESAQYSAVGPFNNVILSPSSNLIAKNGIFHSTDVVLVAPLLVSAPTVPVPTFPPSDISSGTPAAVSGTTPAPAPISAPSPTSPSVPANTTEPPVGPPPFAEPTESTSGAWMATSAMPLVVSVISSLC